MTHLIALHDNVSDEQFQVIEQLFNHNLDMLKEDNKMTEYNHVCNILGKVLDLDVIDKDELQVIIDFAQQEHYMFVENFVDEDFNDFYHDSIKSSFLLLRKLLVLKDSMK